ncbi:hypothetical protein GALMADRAFT_223526 [Galerina marginata CBS 339.88]|uniref:Uncharacterized protein n=1 Tax=Galerina marginata (strain CBS 339.88) TaxID=685588 RepID=A0A067TAA8_GALM3|nr:hypothetical protein GALMADRAFT_223526 [Galerina marginata CBS 339.88]
MKWLDQSPTMLVNIDIAYPGLHIVIGSSSVSAVVANYNSDFAQYPASMTLQQSKIEPHGPTHGQQNTAHHRRKSWVALPAATARRAPHTPHIIYEL